MGVNKMTYNQYLNLMFSLECLYDHHPEFFKELPADEQAALSKMFLYCLLYTSPSPRDLSTSRMPSSA